MLTYEDMIKVIKMAEEDPKKILIAPRFLLAFFRHLHAAKPMHISSEALKTQINGWLLPKRSPIYPSMDWMSV